MKFYLFCVSLILIVSAEQDTSSDLQNLDKSTPSLPKSSKEVDDVLQDLASRFPKLKDLSGELDMINKLDPNNLPPLREGEQILKDKCMKNGHNQSYDEVQKAKDDFIVCVAGLVDVEEMKREIDEATPKGDLDEVFKKYCRRTPILRECIKNFTMVVENCLDPEEQETKEVFINVTSALTNFVCFKEGDRIALFIAEGGPDCIADNFDGILNCLNTTLTKYIPEEDEDPEKLPQLVIEEKHCDDMTEIQKCVVQELETCKEPTPANIVESMFKFLRKSTPCIHYDANDGTTLKYFPLFTLIISAIVLSKF